MVQIGDEYRQHGLLSENEVLEEDFLDDHMMELAQLSNYGLDLCDQVRYLRTRVVIPYMQENSLT
jgi:hypothetical protein